ncbi:MAG: SDR family oxidoreductase [Legionellales bacterium]|nr:SDR family oxidoreductase [Legionellales bacterium]
MNKRVLVLGSAGMLGHKVCELLSSYSKRLDFGLDGSERVEGVYTKYMTEEERASNNAQNSSVKSISGFEVIAAFRVAPQELESCYRGVHILDKVDVLDDSTLRKTFIEVRPDIVINCIGIVKQLNEAYDRYLSVAINSFLPHRLSRLGDEYNARLYHISTDCVFNGKKGMYQESDLSDAEDIYGKSKFLGETDDTEMNALTLRTSIIGRELKSSTHGLLEWMIKQQGKKIKGFTKAIYTGFTTTEFTHVLIRLINEYPTLHGLYHLASDPISKYDLLNLINDIYELDVVIEPDNEFVCDRSLVMTRFKEATSYCAPTWGKMITDMRNEKGY